MVLITTSQYISLLEHKLISLREKTTSISILDRPTHIKEIQETFGLLHYYKNIEAAGELKELESPIFLTNN